jgi:hypothetical protein
MNHDLFPEYFDNATRIAKDASSAADGWADLVAYSGRCLTPTAVSRLASLDVDSAVRSASDELAEILVEAPIPPEVTFLYFGLFDLAGEDAHTVYAGYYVSGGQHFDREDLDTLCGLPYFPENRFIPSDFLDAIKSVAAAERDCFAFVDYAVIMGAAALLTKFVLAALGLNYKTIVGFDDGDYFELN